MIIRLPDRPLMKEHQWTIHSVYLLHRHNILQTLTFYFLMAFRLLVSCSYSVSCWCSAFSSPVLLKYLCAPPSQPTFLVELSKVLANPGNTQVARVAAGLQVKNSLTSKDPDVKTQYQQRWLAIDTNARREIKNYVSILQTERFVLSFVSHRLCHHFHVCSSGFTDSGNGDVPAQLCFAVCCWDCLRRDPRQPMARADPTASCQRDGSLQHRTHEGVDTGGHRIHLPGHCEPHVHLLTDDDPSSSRCRAVTIGSFRTRSSCRNVPTRS